MSSLNFARDYISSSNLDQLSSLFKFSRSNSLLGDSRRVAVSNTLIGEMLRWGVFAGPHFDFYALLRENDTIDVKYRYAAQLINASRRFLLTSKLDDEMEIFLARNGITKVNVDAYMKFIDRYFTRLKTSKLVYGVHPFRKSVHHRISFYGDGFNVQLMNKLKSMAMTMDDDCDCPNLLYTNNICIIPDIYLHIDLEEYIDSPLFNLYKLYDDVQRTLAMIFGVPYISEKNYYSIKPVKRTEPPNILFNLLNTLNSGSGGEFRSALAFPNVNYESRSSFGRVMRWLCYCLCPSKSNVHFIGSTHENIVDAINYGFIDMKHYNISSTTPSQLRDAIDKYRSGFPGIFQFSDQYIMQLLLTPIFISGEKVRVIGEFNSEWFGTLNTKLIIGKTKKPMHGYAPLILFSDFVINEGGKYPADHILVSSSLMSGPYAMIVHYNEKFFHYKIGKLDPCDFVFECSNDALVSVIGAVAINLGVIRTTVTEFTGHVVGPFSLTNTANDRFLLDKLISERSSRVSSIVTTVPNSVYIDSVIESGLNPLKLKSFEGGYFRQENWEDWHFAPWQVEKMGYNVYSVSDYAKIANRTFYTHCQTRGISLNGSLSKLWFIASYNGVQENARIGDVTSSPSVYVRTMTLELRDVYLNSDEVRYQDRTAFAIAYVKERYPEWTIKVLSDHNVDLFIIDERGMSRGITISGHMLRLALAAAKGYVVSFRTYFRQIEGNINGADPLRPIERLANGLLWHNKLDYDITFEFLRGFLYGLDVPQSDSMLTLISELLGRIKWKGKSEMMTIGTAMIKR